MPRQTPGLTALILLAAVTGALPALADPGDVTCYESPGYLVVQRDRKDWRSDFLFKKKAQPSDQLRCAFTRQPGDVLIGGKGKEYVFLAHKSDLLVLKELKGKGDQQAEHLKMITLGQPLGEVDLGIVAQIDDIEENGIRVRMRTNTKPNKNNCPQHADEFEAVARDKNVIDQTHLMYFARKGFFDFASRRIIESSEVECIYPVG